jgi:hypothetical protein
LRFRLYDATADVACKGRTNVVDVWWAVETALAEVADRDRRIGPGAALKAKESRLDTAAAVHSTE